MDAITAELDAIRALRGPERKAALASLYRHGAALLQPMLTVSCAKPPSRRGLALEVLADFHPGSDSDREALEPVVCALLASDRQEDFLTAMMMLPRLGDRTRRVARRLSSSFHGGSPIMIEFALEALERKQRPPEQVAAVLDLMLDHWEPKVRAVAALRLAALGIPPRVSLWEGAPVAPAVICQLQRLGARPRWPFNPQYQSPLPLAPAWKETDPNSGWTVTPAAAAFMDHLEWEHEELQVKALQLVIKRDELPEQTLQMKTLSIDCFKVKDKQLFPLTHSRTWRHCLDLKDLKPDPAVWLLCMGTGRVKRAFSKLSHLLECLDAP